MGEIKEFIKDLFIFYELTDDEREEIIGKLELRITDYQRGECIFSKASKEKKVGFLYSGRAEVRKQKGDTYSVLNLLNEGDSFGILAVFSEEEFPTEIWATKNSKVLFIDEASIKKMLLLNSKISINLIKFMAERISFLNRKIRTFTGTRVEDRLFSYLTSKWEDNGNAPFSLNFKKCSEAINSGRASVYRAISSLVEEKLIKIENKKIYVLNKERI